MDPLHSSARAALIKLHLDLTWNGLSQDTMFASKYHKMSLMLIHLLKIGRGLKGQVRGEKETHP